MFEPSTHTLPNPPMAGQKRVLDGNPSVPGARMWPGVNSYIDELGCSQVPTNVSRSHLLRGKAAALCVEGPDSSVERPATLTFVSRSRIWQSEASPATRQGRPSEGQDSPSYSAESTSLFHCISWGRSSSNARSSPSRSVLDEAALHNVTARSLPITRQRDRHVEHSGSGSEASLGRALARSTSG